MRGNPNTKRFQNFMSKVISSVRTRTYNNRLDGSDANMTYEQSQQMLQDGSQHDSRMIVNEFGKTRL